MARYNFFATIINRTDKTLTYHNVRNSTGHNPPNGAEGSLYHGVVVGTPTRSILPGQSGTFTAKSTGSTIQGAVEYNVGDIEKRWMYFHVPNINDRHEESAGVELEQKESDDHTIVEYIIT